MKPAASWIQLPSTAVRARARGLPKNVEPLVPTSLTGFDRDLAFRLKNSSKPKTLLGLELIFETAADQRPLLVTDVGEALALAWSDSTENVLWYLLPHNVAWDTVLDWLETTLLPAVLPGALVRAHRTVDDSLLTPAERQAHDALAEWEAQIDDQRKNLKAQVASTTAQGNDERKPLLYGSGKGLTTAVAQVLKEASFTVEDLDETFGSGRSGDLLISIDNRYWLVEVTSSSGSPGEIEVGKLISHLDVWPRLRTNPEPLEGGVLVINHNYKVPPGTRPKTPYRRPEFVESLPVRVIGTIPLCKSWIKKDFETIVGFVTGEPGQVD